MKNVSENEIAVATDQTISVLKEKKEERPARTIRNKDRPTMQIYQPGKRRMERQHSNEADHDVSKTSSNSVSPVMDEAQVKSSTKGAGDTTTSNKFGQRSNQRRSSIKNEKKSAENNGPAQTEDKITGGGGGDKKVSRYSERRNRAKEKREAATDVDKQFSELSLNAQSWSDGNDIPFDN